MIPSLVALPIFTFLVILQTTIVTKIPLLNGYADIVLLVIIAWALQERVHSAWQWGILGGLMIGFVSAVNFAIPLVSYASITALALLIRRRIWQIPILAMFVVTLVGTLFSHGLTALTLAIGGTNLPLVDSLQLITLPSLFLNLLLAAPVYAIVRDFANWLHPEEIQI
jgi:hypothetical protein